ncbi:MAG: hypothetical protein BCS36_01485 [Desulfovibrio sp. MES5]|nr:MAG: hypothetical protein BCS36_01485 [Desulfovibrio sp. MES5]
MNANKRRVLARMEGSLWTTVENRTLFARPCGYDISCLCQKEAGRDAFMTACPLERALLASRCYVHSVWTMANAE